MSDRWFSVIVAAVGVMGSVGGAYFTASQAGRASDVEMVKLAVTILQGKDSDARLKEWSVNTLGAYSKVPMAPEKTKAIVNSANQTGTVWPGMASEVPVDPKAVGELLRQFTIEAAEAVDKFEKLDAPMVVPAPDTGTRQSQGGIGTMLPDATPGRDGELGIAK